MKMVGTNGQHISRTVSVMKCVGVFVWCCCILAIVVGQLEPVVECEDDNQVILRVISKIDTLLNIQNIITYLWDQKWVKGTSIATSLQQRLMETFNRPVIAAGIHIGSFQNFIYVQNLAIVFFTGMDDPNLNIYPPTVNKMQSIFSIFVYKSEDDSPFPSDQLQNFFMWCGNQGLFSVFLIFTNDYNNYELWTYQLKTAINISHFSYPTPAKLQNLSYRSRGNMNQRKSLIAVAQSLPELLVFNTSNGNITLGGLNGILLTEFMHFVNGGMDILQLSFDDYQREIREGNRLIDVGANTLANSSISQYSPHVMSTRHCLILPFERRLGLQEYAMGYNRNHLLLIFMALYYVIISVIKWISNPHIPLTDVLYRNFQLVIGQTLASSAFRRLRLSEKCIELLILSYYLVCATLFGSFLTMALIAGLHKPTIIDVDTFLTSELRIMIYPQQMQYIFEHLPAVLGDRLLIVDEQIRDQHILSLNDSYAYFMASDKWVLFEYIQRRLRKPKLLLAPEALCGAYMNMRFYVRPGRPLLHVMQYFVQQVREAGLTEKWMQLGLRQAQQAKLIAQAPYDPPIQQPLPMIFYQYSFAMYAFGVSLGLLSFLLELASMRWNNRNNANII